MAHEVGHILGLRHVTEKAETDATLTEEEVLTSRTQVMGNGTFLSASALADSSVTGMKRFTEKQQNGFKGGGVSIVGVLSNENVDAGLVKKLN